MSAVHQFLPSFSAGDAIGHHVLALQKVLRAEGYDSEVFADRVMSSVRHQAHPYRSYSPGVDDWIVYHSSTGSDMTRFVADAGVPLAVYYHNITPARFFDRWEPAAAAACRAGRHDLRLLAARSRFALANSAYSAAELEQEGFAEVSVVPILVDFAAYDTGAYDTAGYPPATDGAAVIGGAATPRTADEGARWLFVGRLAPNKCQHDIVGAFALYRELFDPLARLVLIGGQTSPLYREAVDLLAGDLGCAEAVEVTDVLTFAEVLAHYRAASVFVSLSEHEGFCVPLLEAMHFGVPVVAYDSSAVGETLGDGGLLLTDKDPVAVASAVHRLSTDGGLRERLVTAGRLRLDSFGYDTVRARTLAALEKGFATHG